MEDLPRKVELKSSSLPRLLVPHIALDLSSAFPCATVWTVDQSRNPRAWTRHSRPGVRGAGLGEAPVLDILALRQTSRLMEKEQLAAFIRHIRR